MKSSIKIRVHPGVLAVVAGVIVILAALAWFIGPSNLLGMIAAFLRITLIPVLIPLVLLILAGFVAVRKWESHEADERKAHEAKQDRYSYRAFRPTRPRWVVPVGAVGILAVIGWIVGLIVYGAYLTPREYTSAVEHASGDPTYAPRAPFVLAEALADRDMQGLVGDRQEVNHLADEEGLYTALVNRRGFAKGYEAVQVIDPAVLGASPASTHCSFDPAAGLRAGGNLPWNNLKRAVRAEVSPLLRMNTGDAYAYCDGDKPVVVWPVTKLSGWAPVIDVPAGVVLYDGHSGEITHHAEVPDQIPGPSYPLSVAEAQREATTTSGSIADWIFNRVGYEDTTGDAEDPNGDNATEMVLSSGEGVRYVTPLTPRGGSQSIVALSEVAAEGRTGLAPLVIHELSTARVANSTIDGRLRSEHAELPWASGMKVFEVAPGDEPGSWVASIGQRQDVTLRALVSAEGSIRLLDRDSGAGREEGSGPETDEEVSRVAEELSGMSSEELRSLIDSALDEMAARAGE